MYAHTDNPLALESQRAIRDALLRLMKTVPYEEIFITQICREANAARQTYYRNFESKRDIVAFHLDELLRQFFETRFGNPDRRGQLRVFFEYMLAQRDFLRVAAKNNLLGLIQPTISDNIARFIDLATLTRLYDPRALRYVTGHIAAAVCSLLTLWTERDFEDTPDWMASLADRLLGSLGAQWDRAESLA